MGPFTFYTPTKVFFGEQAEANISTVIREGCYRKVLIHYGSDRVKQSGLLKKVRDEVLAGGAEVVELGGVEPNPDIALVREGVELCRAEGVDFVLGVGGGSVCDSCKAIRGALSLGIDPWEALTKNLYAKQTVPMGIVLTMAAAGSEMSNSCVITDRSIGKKCGSNHDGNRPQYAFMNPVNTLTTPAYQTAAGVTDIMMHTMERFLTDEPDTPLTDALALALLNTVREYGLVLRDEPENLEARAEVLWASSISHNNLTECGRVRRTFVCHKICHGICGVHDKITHGASLSVIFPAWCLHEYRRGLDRFFTLMADVWGGEAEFTEGMTEEEYKEETILDGIGKMKAYFSSIGMPVTLAELEVDPSEYERLSAGTTAGDSKPLRSFGHSLNQAEILEIYHLAE